MSKIRRGEIAFLSCRFYDGEVPVAAGAVTVQVLRGDGSVLLPAGTAAVAGLTGIYSVALTSTQTAEVDRLTAVWTSATRGVITTYHEIVGGFYVELAEIRARPELDDIVKYPVGALVQARDWFEDLAEEYCDVAFVPRYERDVIVNPVRNILVLSRQRVRKLFSATIDGVAVTDLADWAVYSGGIVKRTTVGGSHVTVAYEHGYDAPDGVLQREALVAIREHLLTGVGARPIARELSIVREEGIVRIAQPGAQTPVGIPSVDQALNARLERRPVLF